MRVRAESIEIKISWPRWTADYIVDVSWATFEITKITFQISN